MLLAGLLGIAPSCLASESEPAPSAPQTDAAERVQGAFAVLRAARQAALTSVVFAAANESDAARDRRQFSGAVSQGVQASWSLGALGLAFGVGLRREELRLSRTFDGLCRRQVCRFGEGARAGRLVSGLRQLRHYRRLSLGAAVLGAGAGSLLYYFGSSPRHIGGVRCQAWVGFGAGGVSGDF